MKDRRIGFVTITGVHLSPDLRNAKIYVSVMDDPESGKQETLGILNRAVGWIRRELGQKIRVKFIPNLEFFEDHSQDYGEKIDRLIDKIHENKG